MVRKKALAVISSGGLHQKQRMIREKITILYNTFPWICQERKKVNFYEKRRNNNMAIKGDENYANNLNVLWYHHQNV